MDAYRTDHGIAQAVGAMNRGKHLRIEDGRGIEVAVVYGAVWITQHEDTNDVCLEAGASFRIDRDGVTFVSALKPSLCTLTPAAKARELRVSMVGAGAAPVELFTTDAHTKPGRFDAWLDRVRAALCGGLLRPTSAAL